MLNIWLMYMINFSNIKFEIFLYAKCMNKEKNNISAPIIF